MSFTLTLVMFCLGDAALAAASLPRLKNSCSWVILTLVFSDLMSSSQKAFLTSLHKMDL